MLSLLRPTFIAKPCVVKIRASKHKKSKPVVKIKRHPPGLILINLLLAFSVMIIYSFQKDDED